MPNILNKKNQLESLEVNNLDSLETKPVPEEKKEDGLVGILGECLTFAPLFYEKFTKKKLPQMGGTLGEMQNSLSQLALNSQQLSTSLAQVINNQQQIFNRLVNLESNASQQLTSLDKRLDNLTSVRLTHEREKKQIEYNQPSKLESEEYE